MFPKDFASFGVDEKDFRVARPKKEIEEIFRNIGFNFRGNIFDAIFERAKGFRRPSGGPSAVTEGLPRIFRQRSALSACYTRHANRTIGERLGNVHDAPRSSFTI